MGFDAVLVDDPFEGEAVAEAVVESFRELDTSRAADAVATAFDHL